MSVSKFESLPNEILINLLEKYINGTDIVTAFAFQLNRRFDALIKQSQRLRFDFMRCHKDDFRLCIGLLPAYVENIQELALSDQHAPGQIHAFLSFFPSFVPFKQLRTLYVHFNIKGIEPAVVSDALDSLSKTTFDTLAIKVTQSQTISQLESIMKNIFNIKTLKKLSFACDSHTMGWEFLTKLSSNIEKLTICGILCDFAGLKYIFECASHLKYLNIRVTIRDYFDAIQQIFLSKNNMVLMSTLHTLILDVATPTLQLVELLKLFLRHTPSLHRLEIKTYDISFEGSAWETLFKTLLPTLTSFNLMIHANSSEIININRLLESLQTPFWIERKNFNVIIMEHQNSSSQQHFIDKLRNLSQYPLNQPVGKWWIGPLRELKGNLSSIDKISSIHLSPMCSCSLQNHYFDNVHHLVLPDVNDELLKWMIKYINCSRIRHLDILLFNKISSKLPLLLSYNRNIFSLRMKPSQLLAYQNACLENTNCLKFLDISVDQHSFKETIIVLIAKLFPRIEHLIINTQDLRNVPMLQFYLPRLRSLTFKNMNQPYFSVDDDYPALMSEEKIRRQSQFLLQRETQWITVWIDEAALQDSFWQMIDTNSF